MRLILSRFIAIIILVIPGLGANERLPMMKNPFAHFFKNRHKSFPLGVREYSSFSVVCEYSTRLIIQLSSNSFNLRTEHLISDS